MESPTLQSKLDRPSTFYKYAPVEDWIEQFFRGESLQFSASRPARGGTRKFARQVQPSQSVLSY